MTSPGRSFPPDLAVINGEDWTTSLMTMFNRSHAMLIVARHRRIPFLPVAAVLTNKGVSTPIFIIVRSNRPPDLVSTPPTGPGEPRGTPQGRASSAPRIKVRLLAVEDGCSPSRFLCEPIETFAFST